VPHWEHCGKAVSGSDRVLKDQHRRLPGEKCFLIRGKGAAVPGEQETHRVSRPVSDHSSTGTASASATEASVRHGGREAPAGGGAGAGRGLWPPAGLGSAGRCGRGDGPCHGNGAGGSDSDRPRPLRAGTGNACVSPARAERCHKDPYHPHHQRPAPDPAGEKRPPGAGRALAGGFGPPAGQVSRFGSGRGDGPCHCSGVGGSDSDLPASVRAGPGNACVSPPARDSATKTRATRTNRGQRPPGAGRALAGGFGPPAGVESAWRCGRGDGPCQSCRASRHAQGHRRFGREQETHAFPPPARNAATKTRATRTNKGQRPTRRARSARRVGAGRWPGGLAPGGRVAGATCRTGAMAPARTGGGVSCFPVRQPLGPARLQHPATRPARPSSA
jgi:hypothetical protein